MAVILRRSDTTQKKTTKPPAKTVKKRKPPVKKQDQKLSLKRLIMGEEKPNLTELEAGSTTVLDILSPITIDTKSRDYIIVDAVFMLASTSSATVTPPL